MKYITRLFFLSIFILCYGCKNESKKPIEKLTIAKTPKQEILDEDFNEFFELFNKDSIFQITRVEFPIKVKEINADFEVEDVVISKSDYLVINLKPKSDNNDYTLKTIVFKNKATIQIRGIGNGIMKDMFFEKVSKQWKLVTWIDEST